MRGELIGVWPETWREIWFPLINEPLGNEKESVSEDIFCDLYGELSKAIKKPTGSAAVELLLLDAITLWELFDSTALRADQNVTHELVKEAFDMSGAGVAVTVEQRMVLIDAALSSLLGQIVTPHLNAQLQIFADDDVRLMGAWSRRVEKTTNDAQASRKSFENVTSEDFASERVVVSFFEAAHSILQDFEISGDDTLSNRYFNLLVAFIDKFSLRYDLRRPCILCPTLPGVFASLVRDLRAVTSQDTHLDTLMKDFENAVRDLRQDSSDSRIKTCIQKQVNLVEAIGRANPDVKGRTLGVICDQVGTWPHEQLKAAMKNLYGFTSDYPGIRHGGTPAKALRAVDMRDMIAMSILLTGFTPYLESRLSADAIFGGGVIHAGALPSVALPASDSSGAPDTLYTPRGFLDRLFFWRRER